MDSKLNRRTAIIMAAITIAQGWGLYALFLNIPRSKTLSLFAYHPAALPAWIAGALIAAAYSAASARSLPYIATRFWDVTALKLLAIPFSLVAGTFEELFFRRELMNLLANHHYGPVPQIAASAIIFGAAHAIWGAFARSWRAMIPPLIWTTALGLVLALTYLLGNRDIAPCIWSHAAIDLAIEPWLLLAVMRRSAETKAAAQ